MAKFENLYKVNYPSLHLFRITFSKRFASDIALSEVTLFATCQIHAIKRCIELGYDKFEYNVEKVEKLDIKTYFNINTYEK